MSYAYRCSKCRGRNTLKHPLEWYVRAKKCRHCGWFRFYVDKARQFRNDYCTCAGYHHTHRKGSLMCEHHPNYEINVRTGRYGEALADVLADIARRTKEEKENELCPVPF